MRDFILRLLQYAVTGGIAAVVDAGGFALLVNAKLGIVAAACLSFWLAALVNYNLTSQFVFNREATLRGFGPFLVAALVGLTVNIGVTSMGVFVVGLPPLAAKLMGIAIAFFVNFLINLRLVFHTKP
jgi:putative flippase GtrA